MDYKSFDPEYFASLSNVHKVLYKTAFEFHMKYHKGASPETAHFEGTMEVARIEKMAKELDKPQMYVDLSTGFTFMATENELESMHS